MNALHVRRLHRGRAAPSSRPAARRFSRRGLAALAHPRPGAAQAGPRSNLQPASGKSRSELPAAGRRQRRHSSLRPRIAPCDEPAGEAIPLEIIYEDDALLAHQQAAGPGRPSRRRASVRHAGQRAGPSSRRAARPARRRGRLGIVHRLDKDTSGLMLIAKTDEVHEKLAAAFAAARGEERFIARFAGASSAAPRANAAERIGRHPRPSQENGRARKTGRAASPHGPITACCSRGSSARKSNACFTPAAPTRSASISPISAIRSGAISLYGRPHPLPDGFAPRARCSTPRGWKSPIPSPATRCGSKRRLPDDYAAARARLLEEG